MLPLELQLFPPLASESCISTRIRSRMPFTSSVRVQSSSTTSITELIFRITDSINREEDLNHCGTRARLWEFEGAEREVTVRVSSRSRRGFLRPISR